MSYYFPILIEERRLHFLELKSEKEREEERKDEREEDPIFNFNINRSPAQILVSVEAENPQLISSVGGKSNNKNLKGNYRFMITKCDDGEKKIPTYKIEITDKKEGKTKDQSEDFLTSKGTMGSEDKARILLNSEKYESVFILKFSYYKDNDDKEEYTDDIKISLYKGDKLTSVALDFGSESSQIRFEKVTTSINIVKGFLNKNKFSTEEYSEKKDFWQGNLNEPEHNGFYDSIFFINKEPYLEPKFAATPKVGDKKVFVFPLMDSTACPDDYNDLVLLPNLKLCEIASEEIKFSDDKIKNIPKSFYRNRPTLGDDKMRESILRLILSNFLHWILSECENSYIRLILLVPNIYSQSKIYKLMRDLYKDYETIKKEKEYEYSEGLEVQVISESDASFMGKMNQMKSNFKKGYYLTIDAGKGTTDFSILRCRPKSPHSTLDSLYRDGIPASSNVITYAFYEALCAFMDGKEINIREWVEDAEKAEPSQILRFTKNLDELKKNYSEENDKFENPNNNDVTNITSLNTYLEKNNKRNIPGCEIYFDKEIEKLVDCLENSINNFMNQTAIKFRYVLLSGRGFLFKPFKKAVTEMLKKWIKDPEESIKDCDSDEAKILCLKGAINLEKRRSVNYNSGLIARPIFLFNELKIVKFLFRLLPPLKNTRIKPLDMNSYYEGLCGGLFKDVDVMIGNRQLSLSRQIGENCYDEKTLFYVGKKFIWQTDDKSFDIDEDDDNENSNSTDDKSKSIIKELNKKALFPYNIKQVQPEKNKASQSSSNNTTAKKEPKKTTSEPDSAEREDNNREATGKTRIDENA